jgi:hypothetical protein
MNNNERLDKIINLLNDNNELNTTKELLNILNVDNIFVLFAEFIISYYEIAEEDDRLLWQLCGTKQMYTSKEMYSRFIDEYHQKSK